MNSILNNLANWLEIHFLPIAGKISNQRHLAAVKDGFIATMPISMVGAISVMFKEVVLGSESLVGSWMNSIDFYANTIQPIIDVTLVPLFGQIWWVH